MQHTEAAKLMVEHGWQRLGSARNGQRWQQQLRDVQLRAEQNKQTGHVIITVICKTAEELEIVLDELGG